MRRLEAGAFPDLGRAAFRRRRAMFCLILLAGPLVAANTVCGTDEVAFPSFAGWALKGAPTRLEAKDVYKMIDGEVELYLPYGLQYALYADYAPTAGTAGRGLDVEVYRMGSALDGFGIFSQCRSKKAKPIEIGSSGSASSTQVMFYKGRYFSRITVSDLSEDSSKALIECAKAIAERLPDSAKPSPELAALDIKGAVSGTEQYFAKDFLGVPFLTRGLVASFERQSLAGRIFVAFTDSPEQAALVFSRFDSRLAEAPDTLKRESRCGVDVLIGHDRDLKGVAVFHEGCFFAGLCDIPDPAQGLPVIEDLLTTLRSVSSPLSSPKGS